LSSDVQDADHFVSNWPSVLLTAVDQYVFHSSPRLCWSVFDAVDAEGMLAELAGRKACEDSEDVATHVRRRVNHVDVLVLIDGVRGIEPHPRFAVQALGGEDCQLKGFFDVAGRDFRLELVAASLFVHLLVLSPVSGALMPTLSYLPPAERK